MKYSDICILEKTSFGKDYYTYSIPPALEKNLRPHQLVVVPFGKKLVRGLVETFRSSSEYQTKEIKQIVRDFPVVLDRQIELIGWMSKFYYTPRPMVAKQFVPKSFPRTLGSFSSPLKQKLILVPTPNYDLSEEVSEPSDIQIFHHGLGLKPKQKIWEEIYTGKQSLIVGTRSALFLPFRSLSQILILGAEDDYYTDKKSPCFNATQVGVKLAKIWGAKLEVKYQASFAKELEERRFLDLPPFKDLLGLTPVSKSNKNIAQTDSLFLALKTQIESQKLNIQVYRSRSEKGDPEIFLTGEKLHGFLASPPKDWYVKVYYLNIN